MADLAKTFDAARRTAVADAVVVPHSVLIERRRKRAERQELLGSTILASSPETSGASISEARSD
jgi:hypothetical protein